MSIKAITVVVDDTPRTYTGRDAWTLDELVRAGERGITPIDNPAPRLSHYVFRLRKSGLVIETKEEKHAGAYPGTHGRYVLRTPVNVVERRAA